MTHREVEPADGELPFEPWTVLRAICLRRITLFLLAPLAMVAGGWIAWNLFRDVHESEAVLLYTPLGGDEAAGMQLPRLESRRHMVKLRPALEEVIRRRGLDVTADNLGAACDATVQRDSNLLSVAVRWNSPEAAAQLANELTAVFLEQQRNLRRSAAERLLGDLERRQERAQAQVSETGAALRRFQLDHHLTNVDEQIRASLADVSALQLQLHQAKIDRQNIALQRKNLDGILRAVRERLPGTVLPAASAPATGDAVGRLHRLRAALEADRTERERRALLDRAAVEMARGQRCAAEGLISQADLGRMTTEHERFKQLVVDTPRTRELRNQIEEIERSLTTPPAPLGSAAVVAPEVVLRVLQVELDSAGIEDKVRYLTEEVAQAQARHASFASIQRELAELQARVAQHERELVALEAPLAHARRVRGSDAPDFVVVSRAVAAPVSIGLRRSVASAGASFASLALCLMLLVLNELVIRRIRSGTELTYFTGLPVWAQTPAGRARDGSDPLRSPDADARLTRLAQRLSQGGPGRGMGVLIGGIAPPAVRDRAVAALVDQYLRQGQTVAQLALVPSTGATAADEAHPSLHDYVRDPTISPARVIEAHAHGDQLTLGGGPVPVAPRQRGSARVRALIDELAARYDVVIVVTDPALTLADDRTLSAACDAVLLVAQAETATREDAQRLARAVRSGGLPSPGWLLVDVHHGFLAMDAHA